MRHPENITRPLVAGLVGIVGALGLTGCSPFPERSTRELAAANGFGGPVTAEGDYGDAGLLLEVGYGACRITIQTANPWYEDYSATYIPEDPTLQPVPEATAELLNTLPEEYDLKGCVEVR